MSGPSPGWYSSSTSRALGRSCRTWARAWRWSSSSRQATSCLEKRNWWHSCFFRQPTLWRAGQQSQLSSWRHEFEYRWLIDEITEKNTNEAFQSFLMQLQIFSYSPKIFLRQLGFNVWNLGFRLRAPIGDTVIQIISAKEILLFSSTATTSTFKEFLKMSSGSQSMQEVRKPKLF